MLIVTSLHALYSYVVQKLSRVACVRVHAGPRYLCLSSRRLSAGPHGCWVVNPRCHFQVTETFVCVIFFSHDQSFVRFFFARSNMTVTFAKATLSREISIFFWNTYVVVLVVVVCYMLQHEFWIFSS